jgi:hypothetical protein
MRYVDSAFSRTRLCAPRTELKCFLSASNRHTMKKMEAESP